MLFASTSLCAQEIEYNAWNATFFDLSLSSSETIIPDFIRLELHNRTKGFYNINDQILIRPAYNLNLMGTLIFQLVTLTFLQIKIKEE